MTTMLSILTAVFQFVLSVSDPSWACKLKHREPDVAGTFYLYCSQMTSDGFEIATVGRFISDAKAAKATP